MTASRSKPKPRSARPSRGKDAKYSKAFRLLPARELKEVSGLPPEKARGRFLGAAIDCTGSFLVLLRGDESLLVVPLSIFRPAGDGTKPDFTDFGVADYGHTVRFGGFEAAADAILSECHRLPVRTTLGKVADNFS